MSLLCKLNECGEGASFLPTIKINKLEVLKKYLITDAKFINTRFGKSIVMELNEEIQVFLPKRFATHFDGLTQQELQEFVKEKPALIYKGEGAMGPYFGSKLEFDQY